MFSICKLKKTYINQHLVNSSDLTSILNKISDLSLIEKKKLALGECYSYNEST